MCFILQDKFLLPSLKQGKPLSFLFVFSSHCLVDFGAFICCFVVVVVLLPVSVNISSE